MANETRDSFVSDTKEHLLECLATEDKPVQDEQRGYSKQEMLAILDARMCMGMAEKAVCDEWPVEKRGRGRPRKDVCRAQDPSKCWKHGYGKKALIEEMKNKGRAKVRLNPQPTEDLERVQEIEQGLREVGWDIEDSPDSKAETDSMLADLNNLRREAGMRKLDDSYAPYAAYRGKWGEYLECKKNAAMLHKQAEIFLKKGNYDDVDSMMESLRKKPQEILDKYQEVVDAYDACCEAICGEIDKHAKMNQDTIGAEKKGFGMVRQEDSKNYQKRMRSLGMANEVPETIKKIDGIVAQTERRWRSVAGMGQQEFDVVKDNFRKTVENLMKGCSLASNLSIDGINGVLEDHLKSQHDLTKKGKMYNDGGLSHHALVGGDTNGPRYKFTRKCFGVDKGLKESRYEKYGCLHTLTPSDKDNLTGGEYGRNVIRWKPHKAVATMTFTDSLCLARDGLNYVNPCLVTSPSPCCFNPMNKAVIDILKKRPMNAGLESLCYMMNTPYCELQLHGENQYNGEAIESISFGSKEDVANLSKRAVQSLIENRIPVYIGAKPIQIDSDGKIKGSMK